VRYEPGAIEARGFKGGKVALTEKRETTGPGVAIRLTADRTEIDADGEDVAILKVEVVDKEGPRSADARTTQIAFKVSGAGKLIGVGNGDPNCQESDKESKRSLFNGLAQAIVHGGSAASGLRRAGVTLVYSTGEPRSTGGLSFTDPARKNEPVVPHPSSVFCSMGGKARYHRPGPVL
jgi:hypothetical protein